MSLEDFSFTDEELANAEAKTVNPYLANPLKSLELIARLIAQPENPPTSREHFKNLCKLIDEDYLELSSRDNFPHEAKNQRDLVALKDTLKDWVVFPDLADKTVIGIGGGFSAGKSRFINTLLGNDLLPESLEPTTAIPSYLVAGETELIRAFNKFDHAVELDRYALQAITHAFPRHYRQQHGMEIGFSHIVRRLMIHDSNLSWQHLAFLDTPGYSKPDHPESAQITDRQIALRQLKQADQILWLINAKNGSIRQDDIEFLCELDHPKPIFFVVTQADMVGKSRISAIVEKIAEALEGANLSRAGLMAWAAPLDSKKGKRWEGDCVHEWLASLNSAVNCIQITQGGRIVGEHLMNKQYSSAFMRCLHILDEHINYNSEALTKNKALLSLLNELFIATESASKKTSSEQSREEGLLKDQISRLREEQGKLNELIEEFGDLRHKMFDSMQLLIADVVGDQAEDEAELQQKHLIPKKPQNHRPTVNLPKLKGEKHHEYQIFYRRTSVSC